MTSKISNENENLRDQRKGEVVDQKVKPEQIVAHAVQDQNVAPIVQESNITPIESDGKGHTVLDQNVM